MEQVQYSVAGTSQPHPKMITGVFTDHEAAECAFKALIERGYSKDEINLVMSDETRSRYFPDSIAMVPHTADPNSKVTSKDSPVIAVEDAAKGSVIGGTIGAIVGIVAAIGTSIVIPGLGIIIAGPIAAGLAGAGAGVITGGIIGALEGAGIPENHAKLYESGINKGNIIISFHPHNDADADYFEQNWKGNQSTEIYY